MDDDIGGASPPPHEPPGLRFLRLLVTTLTAVMIVGLVTIVTLLVMRLQQPAPPPLLPDEIALPEGARAIAVTQAETWYAVVTDRDEILVYDRASGQLIQTVTVGD